MEQTEYSKKMMIAAGEYTRERDYWLQKFSGEWEKSRFQPDNINKPAADTAPKENEPAPLRNIPTGSVPITISGDLFAKLTALSNGFDYALHMILVAGLDVLMQKYTGHKSIIVGTPIYKQEKGAQYINTVLPLKNGIKERMTFKELLLQVRETIAEAVEHQNYPIEVLAYKLDAPDSGSKEFPLFDTAILLENIHEQNYLAQIFLNMIFCFSRNDETIGGSLLYRESHFHKSTVERIARHYYHLLQELAFKIDSEIGNVEILTQEEKQEILSTFNDSARKYPTDETLCTLFQDQVRKKPDAIAVAFKHHQLTYKALNNRSNQLAARLREMGARADTIAAIIEERSQEMMVAIMGILKAGGAYLPIDPKLPANRIKYIINDCRPAILLARSTALETVSLTDLQQCPMQPDPYKKTANRQPIDNLDILPFPDRTLINSEKYSKHISLSMVKNCMPIQGTRGCPYRCTYCSKPWTTGYKVRSAEHIFEEVVHYYKLGIKRFSFIDDIFNLDKKNSERFFRRVIDQGLDIQILFPAGLRGDIMTKEYIDLMVKAGTIHISVALETASPRLQKLIRKNLDIPKLKENLQYICSRYPQVILDLFTMHGFPTETEAEARMTLDFIKELKWLHFPLINVLKIYPNSEMEQLALQNGITKEAILKAQSQGWHEFSDTLPFDKNFTMKYQAEFLNDYFLLKERLLYVLPFQMQALTESEIVQKYDSYLPANINDFDDLLHISGIKREELTVKQCLDEKQFEVTDLNRKIKESTPLIAKESAPPIIRQNPLKVLLLDLSQSFSHQGQLLDDLYEAPLGLLYLLTYLNRELGGKIHGEISKSRIDFDSYPELKTLLETFAPDVIGIRTLTFYKEFFHQTAALLRQWGFQGTIMTGGPYATTSYSSLMQDPNVDVAILGEGEVTAAELIEKIIANNGKLPDHHILAQIPGLVFNRGERGANPGTPPAQSFQTRAPQARSIPAILLTDFLEDSPAVQANQVPLPPARPRDMAYAIYTSGSQGNPKGVLVNHRNAVNLVWGLNERIYNRYPQHLKIALVAPFIFDASVKQVFASLLLGHTLDIAPEETRLDGLALNRYYKTHNIDISDGTPTHIRLLLENLTGKSGGIGIKHIISGGEELPPSLVERLLNPALPEVPVITNVYGPTECTVDATSFEISAHTPHGDTVIPIGTPMPNHRVYIVNPAMQLQPVGVNGELCIGGAGVSRGYLNQIELTAERFVPSPFVPGEKIYRTGDRARWLPDGNIEFSGRLDYQVKIRGYRIELGEIENRLKCHPQIKETVVVAKKDNTGDNYMCGYYESGSGLPQEELRHFLASQLPDYMLPSIFIHMEKIPLTISGKINRRALPAPQLKAAAIYTAPQNNTQKELLTLWSAILGIEEKTIGIHDDFFQLGGQSLKATLMAARIHKRFNVKISLMEIFNNTTISKLAEHIDLQGTDTYAAIDPVEKKEYYPLSSAQKRMYILQQMEEESIVYNIPFIILGMLGLDEETLEKTFIKLIRRHESLRTTFEVINGQPMQKIHQTVPFTLERYDALDAAEVEETADSFFRPFQLTKAPLLRAGVVKTADNTRILLVDMPHIISDGVSDGVWVNDFMALSREEELPPLRIQYKDFSHWQNKQKNSQQQKDQEAYWLKTFATSIPPLDLPTDYPRPDVQSFEGHIFTFEIPRQEARLLRDIASTEGATMYMVLLAAVNILLAKLGNRDCIVLGTPIAGRKHVDLESIIGMFVGTLALPNTPEGSKSFREFLREVKENTLEAFENQDYPFEDLVTKLAIRRDTGRNPLFDVMFAVNDTITDFTCSIASPNTNNDTVNRGSASLVDSPYKIKQQTSKFDLSFTVEQMEPLLRFAVEYCTRLFKKETVERFSRYLQVIVSTIAHNPGITIAQIDILGDSERERLLFDYNRTQVESPDTRPVHHLFEEQARKTPDAAAIIGPSRNMTPHPFLSQISYRELNEKSNQLALLLQEKGIRQGSVIAVMMERSIEIMIGLLAILKSGGGYMPIDPQYPMDRIDYIMADSNAGLLLTQNSLSSKTGFAKEKIDIESIYPAKEDDNPMDRRPGENRRNRCRPTDLAYIIYTSGSTGKPKGVMVEHRNLSAYIRAYLRQFHITPRDTVIQQSSFAFDFFVEEVYPPLLRGGKIAVPSQDEVLDIDLFTQFITRHNVGIIGLTPLQLARLNKKGGVDTIHTFLSGGDELKTAYFDRLIKTANVYNTYGPTESTVCAAYYQCGKTAAGDVPIGKPITGYAIYILDKYHRLLPHGTAGELCIAGAGVSRGYLNRPQLTAEKFIKNPFHSQTSLSNANTLYRSGDLARWLPGGNIQFLGRIDQQVKIRGYRIELGEIERQLLNHPGIKEAVVQVREDHGGDKYLCAYAVYETPGHTHDPSALRQYLAAKLPHYMIPTFFTQLESIPLSHGGKVDTRALPAPGLALQRDYTAPRDELENRLSVIWAEVLGVESQNIGIDGNFFEIGGHSLKAAQLISEIHKSLDVKLPLAELFHTPNIRRTAQKIRKAGKDRFISIKPAPQKAFYPLSPAQKRLYSLHHQYGSRDTTYNMPVIFTLEGDLDIHELETIFRQLIHRHESLRTAFHVKANQVVQVISSQTVFQIERYLPSEAHRVETVFREFIKPFDLTAAPLLRVGVIPLDTKKHIVMVDMPHIISDQISHSLLQRDFRALHNRQTLPALRLQYKDFSLWQNEDIQQDALRRQEAYWLSQFEDSIPKLNMTTDFPRPAALSGKGDTITFAPTPRLTSETRRYAAQSGVTLNIMLLAIYNLLLAQYTAQEDILVGTAVAGRRHADLQDIIGFFVNMLPIRNRPGPDKTFAAFLKEVRDSITRGYDNQDYPFQELVAKLGVQPEPGKHPLVDTVFAFQETGTQMQDEATQPIIKELDLNPIKKSHFDLMLQAIDTGEALTFGLEYSTDLFKKSSIEAIASCYLDILRQVIENKKILLEEIQSQHDYLVVERGFLQDAHTEFDI